MNSSSLYVLAFLLAIVAGALVLVGDDSAVYRIGAVVLTVVAVGVAWTARRQQ